MSNNRQWVLHILQNSDLIPSPNLSTVNLFVPKNSATNSYSTHLHILHLVPFLHFYSLKLTTKTIDSGLCFLCIIYMKAERHKCKIANDASVFFLWKPTCFRL